MIKGLLRVADDALLQRIHEGALQVLERTGLHIRGRFLLQALADAGCRVNFERCRAWFRPELVERQIGRQRGRYRQVRSSLWYPFCRELPKDDAAWPDTFTVDFGFGTPTIYDYPSGAYRKPTRKDQVEMIRLGNALDEARAVNAPFICGDFDPRIEIIESSRLLLLNTRKPGWVGVSSPREVKYLAAMSALATDGDDVARRSMPPVFAHAYCTTSPLKIDTRSCEVLAEALPFQFPVNFAPMPILGGTTPITPAGSAVVATAEILGGITAASLIAPDLYYYATCISGEMDMKTTQVCYATPAAILTDALLHQLFRRKYDIVLNVEPGYLEAKCPGIQATFMKMFRQMALGATAGSSLPIGLLDNGAVFSPTQAMIDRDMNRALYQWAQGVEVSDETLCLDLISEMQFSEKGTYLETEHTAAHFRDIQWATALFDRAYRHTETLKPSEADERLLQAADRMWRELVAAQEPVVRDAAFVRELDRIVAAAGKELLS